MYYLNKMNVNYLHHLVHIERINLSDDEYNNKKKIISRLINHYNNKRSHDLYLII